MTPRYLNLPAAAEYMGLTTSALRSKVARRDIPFIKDGRAVRFDVRDLDAWMHARKVPAAS